MRTHVPSDWRGPLVAPSMRDLKVFRDQPHRFLLELVREHGDVVWYGVGPLRFVIGVHPRHVRHVLVDGQRVYTKSTFQYKLLADVTGEGLLTSDGALWRERRRIQQPAFHRARLDLVTEATCRATEQMWARWAEAGFDEIDVADEMFRLSLDVVMHVLFGHRLGDHAPGVVGATLGVLDHLITRSRAIPGIPSWLSPTAHLRFRRALAVLDDTVAEVLQARHRLRSQPGYVSRDLLDLLLDAEESSRITATGVRNEMLTMIIAGHETVASALTWTWYLIAGAPDVEAALIDEARRVARLPDAQAALDSLPAAGNAVAEGLRLYPPAWIVTRKAEPVEPSDDWLPRNTLVMLSPYVTHRHSACWEDADRFDPGRFASPPVPGSYFPFGAGPRLCIGRDFALVEAIGVLWGVMRRCRLRPLSANVVEYAGVTLQPEGGLRAEVLPHHPRPV